MPAKKSAPAKDAKKKKTVSKRKGFAVYIFRIIRQVAEGKKQKFGVSSRGMEVLESFVTDMFQRVGSEAAAIGNARSSGKRNILSLNDFAAACRFAFPGELGRNAALEGARAVQKFAERSA